MSFSPPKLKVVSVLPLLLVGILGLSVIIVQGPIAAAESEDEGNVTVYRTSGLTDEGVTREAIFNGSADPTDQVVIGDVIILRIESATLAESLRNGNGSTTDRFFDTLEGTADLRIVQTNPTPQRAAMVARLGPNNVSVYRDGAETLVSVNTTRLTFGYRNNPDAGTGDIFGEERFGVVYGHNLTEVPRYPDDPDFPVVELFPNRSGFDDTAWYQPLPPEPVIITVNTHVMPEREHKVRLSLAKNQTIAEPVDTGEGTGFTDVRMDLSSVKPGTPYELELVYDGMVTDRYSGTVREPQAILSNATLRTVDGQTTVTLNANLSHGGSVNVLSEDCVGHGLEIVRPNETVRLSVPLWYDNGTAIRDENPSSRSIVVRAERQKRANASFYQYPSATIGLNTQANCTTKKSHNTSKPFTTSTPRSSPDTTATGTSGVTSTTDTTITQTITPGYGLMVAVFAFLVAGLIKLRQR